PADLAAQRKLTTLFAWNNGLTAPGAGAFFDLTIVPSGGIWITGLETNTVAPLHASMTVDVWVTPNTYVGNERNASLWTKVASGHGNSLTVDVPTAITFAAPFHLAAGSWGMAVYHVDQSIRYTNATATNTVHSNADLTLTAGAARSQLFA